MIKYKPTSYIYLNMCSSHCKIIHCQTLYDKIEVCRLKKSNPITGLWGPEGSGRLRLQITRHSAHEGGKVVTLMHRPPLPPGISWYSFLETESTPGHMEMSAATE